jgi:hypothetical protein
MFVAIPAMPKLSGKCAVLMMLWPTDGLRRKVTSLDYCKIVRTVQWRIKSLQRQNS